MKNRIQATMGLYKTCLVEDTSVGGNAVYGARMLLNIDLLDIYTEPELKIQNQHFRDVNGQLKLVGRIIPNPNTGIMHYLVESTPVQKGVLEVYDMMGNLVSAYAIYPETKQLEIDLTGSPSGVYPYRIILDDSNYNYDKIVLQR